MISKEELKNKYQAIHEHFTFKDFLGLSALIFGLLLSNSSFKPGPNEAAATQDNGKKVEKVETESPKKETSQKKIKKKVKKKVLQIPKKKRQPITASH